MDERKKIASQEIENKSERLMELHRQMMRLPMDERRLQWKYYMARLAELNKDRN